MLLHVSETVSDIAWISYGSWGRIPSPITGFSAYNSADKSAIIELFVLRIEFAKMCGKIR